MARARKKCGERGSDRAGNEAAVQVPLPLEPLLQAHFPTFYLDPRVPQPYQFFTLLCAQTSECGSPALLGVYRLRHDLSCMGRTLSPTAWDYFEG
jgi:hypothetical protein